MRVGSGVMVTDLGSSHGTYVNGHRVATSTGLRAGQRITLGGATADDKVCELQFTLELPPEFQAAATAKDTTADPS
jgi:pSer/pThr/pTyr-binding forkhead associated (FHA) protein